jgi:hypothetical protein
MTVLSPLSPDANSGQQTAADEKKLRLTLHYRLTCEFSSAVCHQITNQKD